MRKRPVFILMLVFVLGMALYLNMNMQIEALPYTLEHRISDFGSYQGILGDTNQGIIIFKEDKVELEAYYPLMDQLYETYHASIFIFDYPLNLEILSWNQAEQVIKERTNIDDWLFIAHGDGATVANRQVTNEAVVSFGGVAAKTSGPCLVIYPQRDGLFTKQEMEASLEGTTCEVVIGEGMNHSYLANITVMAEDHVSNNSVEEQIKEIIELVKNWERQ